MTLLDFGRSIRRHMALVIAVPLVCVLACAGYFLLGSSSSSAKVDMSATTNIVVNSQLQSVAGLASGEGRQVMANDPDFTVTTKADGATMTVSITVEGGSALVENARVANEIADDVVGTAEDFFADTQDKENIVAFKAQVEYADPFAEIPDEKESGLGDKMKYLLVALLGGLFVALCAVVVLDMVRRPVKSIEGVQDDVQLPVLEKLPIEDGGERLLANVRFASKTDNPGSVAVVPVGADAPADAACAGLAQAARAEGLAVREVKAAGEGDMPTGAHDGLTIIRCQSFATGMSAAYIARGCDAVVVTVAQWTDSLKALESAVAELQLADAKLVGIVFGEEVK